MPDETVEFLIELGFGKGVLQQFWNLWRNETKSMYSGESGRRRTRMVTMDLRNIDGLHARRLGLNGFSSKEILGA